MKFLFKNFENSDTSLQFFRRSKNKSWQIHVKLKNEKNPYGLDKLLKIKKIIQAAENII